MIFLCFMRYVLLCKNLYSHLYMINLKSYIYQYLLTQKDKI